MIDDEVLADERVTALAQAFAGVRVAGPALPHLVGLVLGMRAKEQVRRVTARRVVAPMTHHPTAGNRAERQFPRDAMRAQMSAPLVLELAVAVFIPASAPWPALVGAALVDTRPEARRQLVGVKNLVTFRVTFGRIQAKFANDPEKRPSEQSPAAGLLIRKFQVRILAPQLIVIQRVM